MPEFVKHCCKLVRPGGCAIFSTFNQTLTAMLLGIIGAEHVLRVVPMDTHHWYRFVKPEYLKELLAAEGFRSLQVTGCFPVNMLARRPTWMDVPFTAVTYVLVATKKWTFFPPWFSSAPEHTNLFLCNFFSNNLKAQVNPINQSIDHWWSLTAAPPVRPVQKMWFFCIWSLSVFMFFFPILLIIKPELHWFQTNQWIPPA